MTDKINYGDPNVLADVAVGNDKVLTAPLGRFYETISFRVLVTTTATVGNRQLTVEIRDASANVLYTADATTTVAGSQTDVPFDVHWQGDPAIPPNAVIPPDGDIRFYDSASIEATDTFAVRGLVLKSVEVNV